MQCNKNEFRKLLLEKSNLTRCKTSLTAIDKKLFVDNCVEFEYKWKSKILSY